MKLLLVIDDFFIGNGQGTVSDRVWFYGGLTLAITITALTGFATL